MRYRTYLRYEVLRTFRNRRFLIFSLSFPLILFYAVAGPNRHAPQPIAGVSFPLYYMVGMVTWGTMIAVISTGGRISGERQVEWIRQTRITPLPVRVYFAAKVLCGYLMALLTMGALYLAGMSLGVRLPAADWLKLTALLLVGLVPLAVLGVLFGHLLTPDSLGPAIGGVTSLLALLGGSYGALFTHGVLLKIAKCVPSYWLVQTARSALGPGTWPPAQSWIVLSAWTAVLAVAATRVYRRDTARV